MLQEVTHYNAHPESILRVALGISVGFLKTVQGNSYGNLHIKFNGEDCVNPGSLGAVVILSMNTLEYNYPTIGRYYTLMYLSPTTFKSSTGSCHDLNEHFNLFEWSFNKLV